jgi:putative heme-binding domain-containing protein
MKFMPNQPRICCGLLVWLFWVSSLAAGSGNAPATADSKPTAIPPFHVPEGFRVELAAGSPLTRYPLFACFDDRGRLFVAEGTGVNASPDELRARKLGRIVVLEDADRDGRFDTRSVFADGLVFPQGVLWHDGVVYTASHPSIWRLEDPEGRGVASRRIELVTGFHFNGNGCDLHGPFLGPDGRLYWTDGRHGYKVQTRDGATFEGLAARIWRCRKDGTDVERICGGGFDNPVEIAFTPEGEAIGTMDQGPGDCLLHYIPGGVYPMEHACLKEFARTGPLLDAVKQYSPVLPAALCGLLRYRGVAFGPEFRERLLSTHYMVHKVVRHDLISEGSTFRAVDTDFLTTSAHDVRLTDLVEDADGSLLVVDMGAWFTYGFPGSPLRRPDSSGAIYRIRRSGFPRLADPWGVRQVDRVASSPSALISRLDDPLPYVRDRALTCLVKLGNRALPDLEKAVADSTGRRAPVRIECVWALCRIGTPEALAAAMPALCDPNQSVKTAAIHALGLHRDARAIGRLAALVTSGPPRVRRKAAEALGRIGRAQAVPALLAGLKQAGDRFLEHALIYALLEIHDARAVRPALSDRDPRLRRAALIALGQMKGGDLTRADLELILRAGDPELERIAVEVAIRRPDLSGLTQGVIRRWTESPSISPEEGRALHDVLVEQCGEAPIEQVAAQALLSRKTPCETRRRLVIAMGQARIDTVPAPWLEALRRALADPDTKVRREVIAVARARNLTGLDGAMLALVRQSDQPAVLRIGALECIAPRIGRLDANAFELLSSQLAGTADPLLRLAAARALGLCTLGPEQRIDLAGRIGTSRSNELRLVLSVLARGQSLAEGLAVVEALERSPAALVLTPSELDRALASYPPEVRTRAQALRARLAAGQKDKAAFLARTEKELARLRGNADAGHELFLSQKLGCLGCHRAVGRGGTVGPDLSRIGQIRTREELLESILFPDLTVAPEYRSVQVAQADGRVATGLVVRDDLESITLRMTDLSEERVARRDILELAPSAASLMPEGLDKLVTRQELCDLLEFLCAQR